MTIIRPGGHRLTLAVLAAATFGYSASESMLAPALPLIQQAVGASTSAIAWVFTGVLLSGAVSTPVDQQAGRHQGQADCPAWVLIVVCAGTLVAALASSVAVLIVGQLLQGVALGLVPLSIGIIRDTQPPERVRWANGLIIGVAALSSAAGLMIAGLIVARMPYTWLYWLPFGLLAVALAVAWFVVPSCPPRAAGRVDWAGAVLLALGLAAMLIAITQGTAWGWLSGGVLGLVVVSVLMMAAFAVVELRTTEPLVDLRLLRTRAVLLVCAVWFVGGFGAFVFLLIPLVVHAPVTAGHGLADSVTLSGLYLVPLGLVGALGAPLTGRFERRIGTRAVMVLGTGAIVVANVVLLGGEYPWLIVVSTAVAGFGIGVSFTQAINIVVVTVAAEHTASVSGAAVVIRVVGGALGAQVGASILASGVTGAPTWADFRTALLVSTLVGMVAVGLSWAIPTKTTTATAGNVTPVR